MPYKVFFSHSSADRDWTTWIAEDTASTGIEVYMSEYDVQPGRYVADKVKRAIEECDCFVVLVTRSSLLSQYVQQEIGFADGLKKPIIPLVEPGVQTGKLAMLEGREYISFDRKNPYLTHSQLARSLTRSRRIKERRQDIGIAAFVGLFLLAIVSGERE